ncbi:DUF3343 domain-containing protein [Clostridiaceae bacterium M8S5]|nr:DUF3343 domain-containing protein [Clostridiaceae bacterium M8S5]
MKNDIYAVVAFNSTHHAIRGEKLFSGLDDIMTIPTPREITASCGLAIKTCLENVPMIIDIVKAEKLNILGIYKIEKNGTNKTVNQIMIDKEKENVG